MRSLYNSVFYNRFHRYQRLCVLCLYCCNRVNGDKYNNIYDFLLGIEYTRDIKNNKEELLCEIMFHI